MPTGAGKSVCYQVPALLLPGLTLVVSPLIALMKDQVDGLVGRGIAAAAVNSLVPVAEQEAALDRAARGDLKLLYVAPERFKSERFRERMAGIKVSLFAVDEAHCISQWGHDFRPDYRRLGPAVVLLGRPPVLALTATAPREVQDDVVTQLALREPVRFVRGIVRENLRFEVERTRGRDEKDDWLVRRAKGPGATLVYCASRKNVERLHDLFKRRGLPPCVTTRASEDERTSAQEAFLTGGASLLVATNAFGMGVDRPDIRRVVHYEIPRTVEAYVQEAGRAGRDGKPATCTLLFHPGDLRIQEWFLESANPSREIVTEVFRVLREAGEGRLEMTADEIAARMRLEAPPAAVTAALAVLDRASVVRRGKRDENRARVRVLPVADDLFTSTPVPPRLGRLLVWLSETYGETRERSIDLAEVADLLGRAEDTPAAACSASPNWAASSTCRRSAAARPRSRPTASPRTSSAPWTSTPSTRSAPARRRNSRRSSATRRHPAAASATSSRRSATPTRRPAAAATPARPRRRAAPAAALRPTRRRSS
jgi:ATP-dependent DNA helicase RecQ